LHRGDAVGGERVLDPLAALDDERHRLRALVGEAYDAGVGGRRGRETAIVPHDRRGGAVDREYRLAAGVTSQRKERARAIVALRQRRLDVAGFAGGEVLLDQHMRRLHRAVGAELAAGQVADRRHWPEGELDIAREVALVVDVARVAMRALGQAVER